MKPCFPSYASRASWFVCAVIAVGVMAAPAFSARPSAIDSAFDAFWSADDPGEAARAGQRLVKAGLDFDTAWTRLKAGRPYSRGRTGELSWRYPAGAGTVFDNTVEIPAAYDPSRPWQVRVQLHGGVNRPATAVDGGPELETDGGGSGRREDRAPGLGRRRGPNRIAGEEQIYVMPSGWADAQWWHGAQVDNILRLVDRLKRHYNVDESRIYLTGISDGGTGTYFMAMREPTLWSAFLPLNGSIKVLGNRDVRADGDLFVRNLANKPFFIVNGGRDPLYPVADVRTHVDLFTRLGVPLVFRPQPSAGHDTSWWPSERARFEAFVHEHARQAHPARLSWETERTDRYNRLHWLVIDRLGAASSDTPFTDVESFLPQRKPSGRADVERHGNRIEARTNGVAELTFLLSPDVFDFGQPFTVTVNGREAFQGAVKRDVATLITWSARDNDRTMLYGAELTVRVP